MILTKVMGWYGSESAHPATNYRGAKASGGSADDGACRAGPWILEAHDLRLESERRRHVLHTQALDTQNAQIEIFHGLLRKECLNVSWFWNLFDTLRNIAWC
jgi:hypothetical protein